MWSVLRLSRGGVVIVHSAYDMNLPPLTREQRIDAAEDRADQVAFEVARERS